MKSMVRLLAFKLLLKLLLISLLLPVNSFGAVAPQPARTVLVFDSKGNIAGSYVSDRPASYNKMQSTLSGVLYKKAGQSGIQSDGDRIWAMRGTSTIDAVSGVVGTTAAAVTGGLLAAATAPGWAGIAIVATVSTVIGYAVNLGINSLVKWWFRDDQKIDVSGDSSTANSTEMVQGGQYWKSSGFPREITGGNGEAVARQNYDDRRSLPGNSYMAETPTCTTYTTGSGSPTVSCNGYGLATRYPSGAPTSCPATKFAINNVCTDYAPTVFAEPRTAPKTLKEAIDAIPAADKTKPVNPAIIAALANQLWKQAASKPDYQGMPYNYANPITTEDVDQWQKANPDYYPTVDDFVKPNPTETSTGSPWSLPVSGQPVGTPNGTPSAPTGTTNPAVPVGTTTPAPVVNLGADPGLTAPSLETPPTPAEILAPILNLMPALKNFRPNTQAGTCPTPSFQFLGSTQTLTAHCTLIQNNKSIMQAAMGFAWAVMALFIVLSA
jgi:hypothetical protein